MTESKEIVKSEDKKMSVESLENVSKQYVLMYKGMNGQENPFILRAGLLKLIEAKYGKENYEIRADMLSKSEFEDIKTRECIPAQEPMQVMKGVVTVYFNGQKREFIDYGIANLKNTNSQLHKNLLHMASTRATNRAMRLATGMGFCSVEELPDYAGEKEDGSPIIVSEEKRNEYGEKCDCGGTFVLRHGKNGDFYGCTNYRKGCRQTRQVNENKEDKKETKPQMTAKEEVIDINNKFAETSEWKKVLQDFMGGDKLDMPLLSEALAVEMIKAYRQR